MPATFDRNRNCFKRKADGGPGLFDFQLNGRQAFCVQKKILCQHFCRPFQKAIGVLLQEAGDGLADGSIVNGSFQIIRFSSFSCICIKDGRNDEFLSQLLLFRKNAVIGVDFQIFDGDLIVHSNHSLFIIASVMRIARALACTSWTRTKAHP